MHSPMKSSGRLLFPPTKCVRLHRSRPSHVQPTLCCTFCYFSPWSYCRKCLISPDRKCFSHRKTVAFEVADDWLPDRSSGRIFLSRISREWRVPWCRTGSRLRRESGFPSFFRQCLLHGSQKMLLNKHPFSFYCEFIHTNRSDFVLFNGVTCSFVRQVLQWM